jgi:hypothetical protein
LESKAREEIAHQCESYVAQMTGASQDDARLEVCPSGISYRNNSNNSLEKDHFIPWRKVDELQYSAFRDTRTNSRATDSLDIQIAESTGFPFLDSHHDFTISTTPADVKKVVESLKRCDAKRESG